jgi:hypothetical protein
MFSKSQILQKASLLYRNKKQNNSRFQKVHCMRNAASLISIDIRKRNMIGRSKMKGEIIFILQSMLVIKFKYEIFKTTFVVLNICPPTEYKIVFIHLSFVYNSCHDTFICKPVYKYKVFFVLLPIFNIIVNTF